MRPVPVIVGAQLAVGALFVWWASTGPPASRFALSLVLFIAFIVGTKILGQRWIARRTTTQLMSKLNDGDLDGYLGQLDRMRARGSRANRRRVVDTVRILRAAGLTEFDRLAEAYDVLRRMDPDALHPNERRLWHFQMGLVHAIERAPGLARYHFDALSAADSKMVASVYRPYLAAEIAFADGEIDSAVTQMRAAVKALDTLARSHPGRWLALLRLADMLRACGRASESGELARELQQRAPTQYLKSRAARIRGSDDRG